jgi:hypothetical protein
LNHTVTARLLAFAVVAGLATSASAAFIEPADATGSFAADPAGWGNTPNTVATVRTTPTWNRPDVLSEASLAYTTYQAWDVFTQVGAGKANSPNVPGVVPDPPRVEGPATNPNGTAAVFELTGAGFVTGGGNIYSPGAPVSMKTDVPNYNLGSGYQTHVVLQIRTQGTNIDTAALAVNGVLASTLGDYSYQPILTVAMGAQGSLIDHKFEFTIPGNNALDSITWNSIESSSSHDKVSIDTRATAVPEPSSVLLSLAGLGMLLLGRPLLMGNNRAKR